MHARILERELPHGFSPIAKSIIHRFRLCVLLLTILCFVGVGNAGVNSNRAVKNRKIKEKQSRRTKKMKRRESKERATKERRKEKEREEFDEGQAGEEEFEDPDARLNWFLFQRAYPSNEIPKDARRRAWDARPRGSYEDGGKGRLQSLAASQLWRSIGPTSVTAYFNDFWGTSSGRINAIAISPNDPNLILIGSSTGGIWRSTDGGATFAPASDNQVDLAVGSIAFAKSNPSIVYAGMGDVYGGYVGTGVLKSTDGGQTWTRVSNATLPAPGTIAKIDVDPNDPNRVYVAQYIRPDVNTGSNFASGFYISTDGGVNWASTLRGLPRDFVISPSNSQTLFLAMRRVDPTGAGSPGLYESTDGGQTWKSIYTAPYDYPTLRDIRVSVTPANSQRLYLYLGRTSSPAEVRVVVSNDGGANWTDKGGTGIDAGQFGYNTYLFADPSNADVAYIGARDVFKTTDGGTTWQSVTKTYTLTGGTFHYAPTSGISHPDQHSFAFMPNNSNTIFIGNDGGLYKSTDAGATIHSLNATLSLSQYIGLSIHPTDPTITYGGTQDNGTHRRTRNSDGTVTKDSWNEFATGDGGRTVIDPLNPTTVFTTYVYGSVYRYTNNGDQLDRKIATESTFSEPTSTPRIAFYPPFVGNGVDQKIYFGSWRVFISSDLGNTWSDPGNSTDLTKGGSDVLSAIGVARSNTSVIYTGSAQGRAMISSDEGKTWTEITTGLPNRSITSIVVSATDPASAYLTVSGYGTGHIFKTNDSGKTWTDISGNLPNIPTSALLVDPSNANTLYAGTDTGVFRSLSGGGTWENFSNGMPPVVISAFTAQTAQNGGRIQAGTYGRGIYELVSNSSSTAQFSAASYSVRKDAGSIQINVTRTGDASDAGTISYATSNGTANDASNYSAALGTLRFAAGETQKSFTVFITHNAFVEGDKTFNVTLSNPTGNIALGGPGSATVTIVETNTSATDKNPIDDAPFYVRQHYVDFLNREPDQGGLNFWINQIASCNGDPSCIDIKRQNVSAAYFLSREFQETGFYVIRLQRAAFGKVSGDAAKRVTFQQFLTDSQAVGRGFVDGQAGADQTLDQNKTAYAQSVVASAAFTTKYPTSQTAAQFVDALYATARVTPTAQERQDAINAFGGGDTTGRAATLRKVAESNSIKSAEFNAAFVLLQYFGYLRRNPTDPPDTNDNGYQFWLKKLNDFGGDYIRSEMVRSFTVSQEYRKRFGK